MASKPHARCECIDIGCPVHRDKHCEAIARLLTVFRIDMVDRTGTRMCHPCADDALSSGVFSTERN